MVTHLFRKYRYIVPAITLLILLLIFPGTALANTSITGVVLDISTRQPLPDANVIVQGDSLRSNTDEHGRFRISGLPPGRYTVEVSYVGYRDQSKTVVLSDLTEKHLTIFLDPISIPVDGITVTANRMEQMSFSTPMNVSTTSAETFPERNVSSTADILREEPAILVQKTTHGHGAPVLRGLIGKHVLLLYDGIRLNKSTFRFGANQYLNTIDLNSLSRIEVVRGPSSVMYGSDAIGGVVNLVPRRVPACSGQLSLTTEARSRYSTADHGRTFQAAVGARTRRIWLALDGTYKKIGDLRAGNRIGTQNPTGWEETDFGGQIAVDLNRHTKLRLDYLGVRQQRVPRYDKYVSGEFQKYIYDPQDRDMLLLTFESKLVAPAIHSLKCGAAYQQETEGRFIRRTGSDKITESLDRIKNWGGYIQLSTYLGTGHWLSYGIEHYHDRIESERTAIIGSDIDHRENIRPTFPDGSEYRSVGIFAQDEFSVVPDVTLIAGVRYSHFMLKSLLESPYGEIKDSYGDVTGSLALTCMLSNDLNLIGSWSRGFRAPNLNDVVVLKESSSGVDAPSRGLGPEKSNNFELGAKLRTDRTRGNLFFYYNILSDMIDRKPGTYDGKTYVDLNDNGEQDSDEPDVFQRQNVGRSRIYGVEFDASAKLTDVFKINGNCFWTYGKNQTDNEPLSRIPPLMGMLALRMDVSRKHWVEFYVRAATSQRRLSQRDIDDSRIEENGTPSWATLNLRAGIALGDLNLNLGFENLADATYKEHGSGVYSPGRNMTLTLTYRLQ